MVFQVYYVTAYMLGRTMTWTQWILVWLLKMEKILVWVKVTRFVSILPMGEKRILVRAYLNRILKVMRKTWVIGRSF